VTLTADERAYLMLYTPRTHGVELPRDLAKSMEAKGWVEWVPPMFGSSRLGSASWVSPSIYRRIRTRFPTCRSTAGSASFAMLTPSDLVRRMRMSRR
jgi:hypothetical protein